MKRMVFLILALAACSGANRSDPGIDLSTARDLATAPSASDLAGVDLAGVNSGGDKVVVNELNPNGPSSADPDWAELKNLGPATADLSGWQVRDNDTADLFTLPPGTTVPPNGYLLIYCDDQADGGIAGGLHVPWKLSGTKGDEFHLLNAQSSEVDSTSFGANAVPAGKSWARLPDGTGAFAVATPSEGVANTP